MAKLHVVVKHSYGDFDSLIVTPIAGSANKQVALAEKDRLNADENNAESETSYEVVTIQNLDL